MHMQDHDPTALDENAFKEETPLTMRVGVFYKATLIWKGNLVAFMRRDGGAWVPINTTGQWTVLGGCALFLRGGYVSEKS